MSQHLAEQSVKAPGPLPKRVLHAHTLRKVSLVLDPVRQRIALSSTCPDAWRFVREGFREAAQRLGYTQLVSAGVGL